MNAIQDLLIYYLRGLAPIALKAKELDIDTHAVDVFTCEASFATMTNVNFSEKRFVEYLQKAIAHRANLKAQVQQATDNPPTWAAISDVYCHYTLHFCLRPSAILAFWAIARNRSDQARFYLLV